MYIHCFKLYGQSIKKMKAILHAAEMLMQKAKLLKKDFVK